MTPERFWALVDSLGGVANRATCAPLDELLREGGEGEAFYEVLDRSANALVDACRWPLWIRGSDQMFWVAAAVIAAGRPTYERIVAAGEVDPEQWDWDEAEELLVAGFDADDDSAGPPESHGGPRPPLDILFQWLAVPSPEGMTVPMDHHPEMAVDLGDGPGMGQTPVHDPDWMLAQARLCADTEVVERRRRLAGIDLHLSVRPDPAPGQPAPSPEAHMPLLDGVRPVAEPCVYRFTGNHPTTVVLCVPASTFPEGEPRVGTYITTVHWLLDAAEQPA